MHVDWTLAIACGVNTVVLGGLVRRINRLARENQILRSLAAHHELMLSRYENADAARARRRAGKDAKGEEA